MSDTKPHLINPHKLDGTHGRIKFWGIFGGGGDGKEEKEDEDEEKEIPDYTFQKERLGGDAERATRIMATRYSAEAIQLRQDLGIAPNVYLKINALTDIEEGSAFFTQLGLKQIEHDELTKEYIVSQSVPGTLNFISKIKEFSLADTTEGAGEYAIITLIKSFSVTTNTERKRNYYQYINPETNKNYPLNIGFFEGDINSIKNSFIRFGISEQHLEIKSNSIKIKEDSITLHQFNLIEDNFDFIKIIETNYTKIDINSDGVISEDAPVFEFDNASLGIETVCIVDSGVQRGLLLDNYINSNSWCNYGCQGLDPFEDSEALGHGTGVGSIVIFGKQFLSDPITTLNPICHISSLRLPIGTPFNSMEMISAIEKIYMESQGTVKIFNLSIGQGTMLRNQAISSIAQELDRLMHKYDLLCIISAGNIDLRDFYARTGRHWDGDYPIHWHFDETNISTPADSINAITVGSIGHTKLGPNFVSKYSCKDYLYATKKTVRLKPDLIVFGGDLEDFEYKMIGVSGKLVEQSGTSFAAPYITHLVTILKNTYPSLRMITLRAILMNSVTFNLPDEKTFYKDKHLDIAKIYGHGTLLDEHIEGMVYSKDSELKIIIEDEMDYALYQKQKYPFLTYNLKIPLLEELTRKRVLTLRATLVYNPLPNTEPEQISDYNPCFIGFYIHRGNDVPEYIKGKNGAQDKEDTSYLFKLSKPTNGKWSDQPHQKNLFNNCQTISLEISKKEYNKFVESGLQITIKSMLKDNEKVIEYYKNNKQNFSLVISIADAEGAKIYDEIKTLNSLVLANESKIKLKL